MDSISQRFGTPRECFLCSARIRVWKWGYRGGRDTQSCLHVCAMRRGELTHRGPRESRGTSATRVGDSRDRVWLANVSSERPWRRAFGVRGQLDTLANPKRFRGFSRLGPKPKVLSEWYGAKLKHLPLASSCGFGRASSELSGKRNRVVCYRTRARGQSLLKKKRGGLWPIFLSS
jgi:hypothetical protein